MGVPDHRDEINRTSPSTLSRINPLKLTEKFVPKPYVMYGSRMPNNSPYNKKSREGELRSNYLGFLRKGEDVYGKTRIIRQAKWFDQLKFKEELPRMVDFCDTDQL